MFENKISVEAFGTGNFIFYIYKRRNEEEIHIDRNIEVFQKPMEIFG